jgi:hypothetical protein
MYPRVPARGAGTKFGGPAVLQAHVCFLTGRRISGPSTRVALVRQSWDGYGAWKNDGCTTVAACVHPDHAPVHKESAVVRAADGRVYRFQGGLR